MHHSDRCSKKYKYKIQFFTHGLLANGLTGRDMIAQGNAKSPAPTGQKTIAQGIANSPAPTGQKTTDQGIANSPAPTGQKTVAQGIANSPAPTGQKTVAQNIAKSPAPMWQKTVAQGIANSPAPTGQKTTDQGIALGNQSKTNPSPERATKPAATLLTAHQIPARLPVTSNSSPPENEARAPLGGIRCPCTHREWGMVC
jgi:hypothetical protein